MLSHGLKSELLHKSSRTFHSSDGIDSLLINCLLLQIDGVVDDEKYMHRKYDGVHVYWKEKVTSAAAFIWNCKMMFAEAKAASESK